MISIQRAKVPKPAILDEPYKSGKWKGKTERQKAIAHFTEKGSMKGFEYKKYSDTEVKSSLAKLFHHKCAYCESKYGATQPMDVEHYRPKKVIVVQLENGDSATRYGYYWLGSDWDNLLPSCADCNRQRYHESEDEKFILAGKKNLFPIADEGERAQTPGDEDKEDAQRLLLDPCRDQRPEQHLTFTQDGVVSWTSRRGEASIEVYGLWRPGLAQARRDRCILIRGCIQDIKRDRAQLNDFVKLLQAQPDNDTLKQTRDRAKQGLASHLAELHRLQQDEKPYTGMVRQIIKQELPGVFG